MPDYKELYLEMLCTSDQAVNLLIAAQRECEELYISSPEAELKIFDSSKKERQNISEDSFSFAQFQFRATAFKNNYAEYRGER